MGIAALIQVAAQIPGQLLHCKLFGLVETVLSLRLTVIPPCHNRSEVFQLHGLGFAEMLVALRHVQPIEPGGFRRAGAVKEQDVGGDGGVGRKHASRHPHYGMQIEFVQQLFLDADLRVVGAEQEAVGQDYCGPAVLFQAVHDHGHEKVSGLAGSQVRREMVLDVRFFAAAVGRIHEDHVELVVLRVVQHVPQEGIVPVHLGNVQIVQQHIGDAQRIGKGFLFNAVNGFAVLLLVVGGFHLGLERFEPAGNEAARTAGKICNQSNFDTKDYVQCP